MVVVEITLLKEPYSGTEHQAVRFESELLDPMAMIK